MWLLAADKMISVIVYSILAFPFAAYLSAKFYMKFTQFWCTSPECLVGKTAIVTGGCAGIGYEIVIGLAARGCKVIVADKAISENKKDEFIKVTRNSNIVLEYVDLASFESVREFAERIKKSENKLDILINHAGMVATDWISTEDGLNIVLQVNYYSPFLLTHLLLDLLKESQSGRIIFTSSMLCFFHFMTADQLKYLKPDTYLSMYSKSKYLQIISADKLAEKLKVHNITSNCWHPLFVYTAIFKTSLMYTSKLIYSLGAVFLFLISFIAKTPVQGAQTAIYLACSDEVKNTTGKYFGEGSITFKPSYTEDFQNEVWKHTQQAVKLKPEEKM